jgi:hypothetical protein
MGKHSKKKRASIANAQKGTAALRSVYILINPFFYLRRAPDALSARKMPKGPSAT